VGPVARFPPAHALSPSRLSAYAAGPVPQMIADLRHPSKFSVDHRIMKDSAWFTVDRCNFISNKSLLQEVLQGAGADSLKGLVIKILSSILNSSASIHPLYHPLSTVKAHLSLYLNISMWDLVLKDLLKRIQLCNRNLIWFFWFVSYNIF
jgi:hypothetical protein